MELKCMCARPVLKARRSTQERKCVNWVFGAYTYIMARGGGSSKKSTPRGGGLKARDASRHAQKPQKGKLSELGLSDSGSEDDLDAFQKRKDKVDEQWTGLWLDSLS